MTGLNFGTFIATEKSVLRTRLLCASGGRKLTSLSVQARSVFDWDSEILNDDINKAWNCQAHNLQLLRQASAEVSRLSV